ncbi:MAG: flagellar basal body P-ring formation chaperone FlgA [Opitutaceae bacterium]
MHLSLFLRFLGVALLGAGGVVCTAAESPASAEIAPVASALTREQLAALVARDLSAHFRLEGELQVELLRPWAPSAATANKWAVTVSEYPLQASSSMLVRCRLVADGVPGDELTLVLRGTHWCEVWAARQMLDMGATFDPTLLETRRVDLFRERDVVLADAGDRSYIFTRGVSPGRLLTWHDLSRRPLVKKGQLVEVTAVDGLLSISMKALALENGAQGETVTVRNPESRKDFSALVIDENHVQVHF